MKTAHFAAFWATQNARRLADSGAGFGETEAWVLAGILLAVVLLLCWLIGKM